MNDLILKCLTVDEFKRISLEKIMDHCWLNDRCFRATSDDLLEIQLMSSNIFDDNISILSCESELTFHTTGNQEESSEVDIILNNNDSCESSPIPQRNSTNNLNSSEINALNDISEFSMNLSENIIEVVSNESVSNHTNQIVSNESTSDESAFVKAEIKISSRFSKTDGDYNVRNEALPKVASKRVPNEKSNTWFKKLKKTFLNLFDHVRKFTKFLFVCISN